MVRYILGQVSLSFGAQYIKSAFLVLSRLDIQFQSPSRCEKEVTVKIPLYRKKKCISALKKEGIDVKVGKVTGLPALLYRYRKRFGIPVGAVICALMVSFSTRVIWCVNVEGNKNVPDKVITDVLESLGCGVGDTYEDIDFDMLHNKFLMECRDISWIAVNMNGTHANVEVREAEHTDSTEDEGTYNIVAAEDGTVVQVAAEEGKPLVSINDTVKKGELLISAAISYKETFNRYESAKGSVYARVKRDFQVKIPLKQEIKVPTGRKIQKKSLTFFDFDINLFLNSSIPYEFCDKITVYRQISLFRTVMLPLYVSETEFLEYELCTSRLTESEAKELAMAEYRRELSRVLGTADLLSKNLSESFDGENYTVRCEVYCLADIGEKKPVVLDGADREE